MPVSASSRKGGIELETKVRPKLRSTALEQFQEATRTLVNPSLKKWKDSGGKVIGCYCSYIPEEIVTAAGRPVCENAVPGGPWLEPPPPPPPDA